MIITNLNNKIGGKGHVVEVDESHLFVRNEKSEHDDLYLFEFLYIQTHIVSQRNTVGTIFTEFLQNVSKVYLGYGNNTFVLEEVF